MTVSSEKRVNDLIGDSYMNWAKKQKILISTPTGSGKTSFIFEKLLPYATRSDDSIIYFCNRTALSDQVSKRSHDNLTIMTYQLIEIHGYDNALKKVNARKGNKYLVFDEAHYFLHDATFNARTDIWRDFIRQNKNDYIFIFLTATPEELILFLNSIKDAHSLSQKKIGTFDLYLMLKESIKAKNKAQLAAEEINPQIKASIAHFDEFEKMNTALQQMSCDTYDILLYDDRPSYNYIDVRYFQPNKLTDAQPPRLYTKYDNIVPLIKQSKDKWLIFVNNKLEGEHLSLKLNIEMNSLEFSKFVDSTTKARKNTPLKELAEREEFNCMVLIATSVIDNGINIEASEVKNVVISTLDKTTFLQMLGRRRVKNKTLLSEKITLYIMSHTLKELNCIQQHNIRKLRLIKTFDLMEEHFDYPSGKVNFEKGKQCERELLLASQNQTSGFQQLFKITSTNRLGNSTFLSNYSKNESGLLKLLYDLNCLNSAINEMKANISHPKGHEIAFLSRQLGWIDKEYDESAWVESEKEIQAKNDLIKRLRGQCTAGYITDVAIKNEFIISCFTLLNDAGMLPPKHKNDLSRYERNQTTPGQAKLNNALEYNEIPYTIETWQTTKNRKKITCWKIVERSYSNANQDFG